MCVMAPGSWQQWLERIYSLRRDKRGSHECPHKPVLLLALFARLDQGGGNAFPPDADLQQLFRRYFDAVRGRDDRPSLELPFYHLAGDGFWELVPVEGGPAAYVPGDVAGPGSLAALRRRVAHGRFTAGFWEVVAEPVARHQLREAIFSRYFPEQRAELQRITAALTHTQAQVQEPPAEPPGRDAAFRRLVREVYDCTCAACGARLVLGSDVLVEAAHLVPFSVGRDDRPTNGLALCPNHHWAMDRHLIAPCPDGRVAQGVWRVSPRLDDRLPGQQELHALDGRKVIAPRERKFYPDPAGLRWREERLAAG